MKSNRKNAVLVGIFILIAYGVLASSITDSKPIVMLSEIISGLAVIGIAVILFPYFKPYNIAISKGYLYLRIIDGLLLIISGFLFLSNKTTLLESRDTIYTIQAYIFIFGSFLLYYLFYISKIIPRFVSIWGFIAIILLLSVNLSNLAIDSLPAALMAIGFLPIVLNEVFIAIWLFIKGFSENT